MKSRIYTGVLRHRRKLPRVHEFQYRLAMPYIRLDELPQIFAGTPLWSADGPALASFKREDFLGDPAVPLEDAVRERILQETGATHKGPIYLLANLRYFGYSINPIACYYCFSEDESRLEYLVAEVNNTPWDERHSYVLTGPESGVWLQSTFAKMFHVSPFNPMDMRYRWRSNTPADRLVLHMANESEGQTVFDASLTLEARPMTAGNLNRMLLQYPFMTAKIALGIYWQAVKLYLKGIPFYTHPDKQATGVK